MYILSLSEVIALKGAVKDAFSAEIHFCDRCGGQTFELEKADPALKEFICRYLEQQNLIANFSADGLHFYASRK